MFNYLYDTMSYLIGKSLGLESMVVNIEDTSYLSTYFNITEFNPVFGAGKNLLIINATSLLSPSPNIQIEARDGNNNYLYIESAQLVDKVSNKQQYYYSLYVYDNLVGGTGKITIVGTTKDNKKVRWSSNIAISPTSENRSKIVFFNKPQLNVIPVISNVLSSSVEINPKSIQGSFSSTAVTPPVNFDITNNYNPNNVDYRIIDNTNQFDVGMESFPITLYINQIKAFNSSITQNVSETASILVKRVLNQNSLLLAEPYIYQNNKISEIVNGTYICKFNNIQYKNEYWDSSSYSTQFTDLNGTTTRLVKNSYALVGYTNLNTFSGLIQKHKIYKKNLSTAGDFGLVTDEIFSNYELLKDVTTPNKSFEKLGSFFTQFHINNFWFTSSNNFNLYHDDGTFLNGMNISGSNVGSGYIITKPNTSYTNRDSGYIPFEITQSNDFSGSSYDSNFLHFYPNSRYTLELNAAFLNKNISDTSTLNFYITSSSPNIQRETGYDVNKGILIGTLSLSDLTTTKVYDSIQSFDFNFLNETYGTLVIYGNNFTSAILSNISIKPTNVFGFSNDTYFTKVPFDVNKPNDIFDIKSELYDKDGNLAYNNLNTVQYFDPNGLTTPITLVIGTTITAQILSGSTLIVDNAYITNKISGSIISSDSASYLIYSPNNGTSSYAISSSRAITASYALTSQGTVINAITASYLNYTGGNTGTASYAITASYSMNGGGASSQWTNISGGGIYYNGGNIGIGTSTPDSKLQVIGNISCSVITASLVNLKNAVLFDYNKSTANTVTNTVIENLTQSYNSAFFDYVVINDVNLRAGTILCAFTGSNITYTEYSTTDIGVTSDITMSVDLNNSNIRLLSTIPFGQTWDIKAFGRYL